MKKKYECWVCSELVTEDEVDMPLDNDSDLGFAATDSENRKQQWVVCTNCNHQSDRVAGRLSGSSPEHPQGILTD